MSSSEAISLNWYRRFYAWVANWHVHRGVRVTATILDDALNELALARVFAALDVLHAHCPAQLKRIPILLHSLAVTRLVAALGSWRSDLQAALLDRDFILAPDTTPEMIAAVIVHELTHARLERAGLRTTPETRARCERICCLAERNYIARLPDASERQRLEEWNERYLAAAPEFWSDAAMSARAALWRSELAPWRRIGYDLAGFIRRVCRTALLDKR